MFATRVSNVLGEKNQKVWKENDFEIFFIYMTRFLRNCYDIRSADKVYTPNWKSFDWSCSGNRLKYLPTWLGWIDKVLGEVFQAFQGEQLDLIMAAAYQ